MTPEQEKQLEELCFKLDLVCPRAGNAVYRVMQYSESQERWKKFPMNKIGNIFRDMAT